MPNNYQEYVLSRVDLAPVFQRLAKRAMEPGEFARFLNLSGSARALVVARLQQLSGRPVLVVTPDAESAEAWFDDFQQFGPEGLLHFPMAETLPYEAEEPVIEIVARQYTALYYLATGERPEPVRISSKEQAGAASEVETDNGLKPALQTGMMGQGPSYGAVGEDDGLKPELHTPAGLKPGPLIPTRQTPALIVAPVEALQRKTPGRAAFEDLVLTFSWGDRFDMESVLRRLVEMGYERETMAETRGEFSVRGHIVDVFPPHLENPVRFDLFGDEIESIRFYDPSTQRSLRNVDELERVTILPAAIYGMTEELARRTSSGKPARSSSGEPARSSSGQSVRSSSGESARSSSGQSVRSSSGEPARSSSGQSARSSSGDGECHSGETDPALVSLADWLPPDTLVILDTPEKFDAALDQFYRIAERRYKELTEGSAPETVEFSQPRAKAIAATRGLLPPATYFLDRTAVQRAFDRFAQIHLPQINIQHLSASSDSGADFDFRVQAYDTIPPDLNSYLSLIKSKQAQDFSIHIICDNDGQVMRLEELLREHDVNTRRLLPAHSEDSRFMQRDILEGYQDIILTTGPMHTGFIFPEARLLMITDREMFGRYKRRHVYRKAYKGRAISSVSDIQRGDYVVHVDHGIGRFLGIRRQRIDERLTELLELEYAEGNKLLVPIENVGRIQKYSSTEGAVPVLDHLGGKRWGARKKKSQERIERMAQELLEIYARREAAEGYAFGPDSTWQSEFEESFIYEETPDQFRAIGEIKDDMISPKPMDRLLCGDVGFGKTEVAMRGVFKCVEEKKQAAILVPTTILAQQHYTTFTERFADYPFRIDVISRFRTDAEQREIIKKLKTGEIDVIIGTHRLLSSDVQFADLGLLVVDEEHRFGVAQKEKIKAMRASVDILTLSATPIPRTLHLALGGLRDMSTINTPPRDRLPVRTRVIRFSPQEIEEAVMREINRGGQIYFVHNRIQNIDQVARRLHEIAPRARIAIGHGQMHERELEQVMLDFIDRRYDILLSTTIIESGLDIPNVNTIIINRADAFGLAQLYQLRGRVGRDVKRAYAYLIVPEGRPITDTAVKRLRAIEEFTELGMGFQLAMRDLEIRGTGNILGPEQHGVIDNVGFELYCTMLQEAVQRLRGGGGELDRQAEIKWGVSALLPAEYVPVESQRIAFYKRLAAARGGKDIQEIQEELRDRYGAVPAAAKNLIGISLLRVLARRCGIESVATTAKGFRLVPGGDLFDLLRRALPLQDSMKEIRAVSADSGGAILFEIRGWNIEKGLPTAVRVVRELAKAGE
jgi:transcription-repair coupling factor (superfamily II helicase)